MITARLDHPEAVQMGPAPGEAIRVLQALSDCAHGVKLAKGAEGLAALTTPDDEAIAVRFTVG